MVSSAKVRKALAAFVPLVSDSYNAMQALTASDESSNKFREMESLSTGGKAQQVLLGTRREDRKTKYEQRV